MFCVFFHRHLKPTFPWKWSTFFGKKTHTKWPRGSRFIPPFHQFLCNSSEIEVFLKYDKYVCACVVESGYNKYIHTYGTKSKKLHKTKIKHFPQLKFLSCVPFVCTYCGSIFSSRELQYSSLTYFDFDGIGLTDVKLWRFEVRKILIMARFEGSL